MILATIMRSGRESQQCYVIRLDSPILKLQKGLLGVNGAKNALRKWEEHQTVERMPQNKRDR